MRKGLAFVIPIALIAAAPALAGLGDIHPTELPGGLIAPGDTVTLRWAEDTSCLLGVGATPGQPDFLVAPIASQAGALSFEPENAGLGAGAWYGQLSDEDGVDSSLPFALFVEAPTAPVMVSPQNGGEVPPGSVRLSWEPVLGVPYYHVILSDQEIVIGEDEDGETVIMGANIIWQAIVAETGADYGGWDPSGFFDELNGTPPPLVPGPEYNWLVLNNYGNNPALTSTRQAGVSAFTVLDDGGLDPPQLLEPAQGDSLDAPLITFRWSEVPEASHYHFALSRLVDSDANEGAVGVFDQVSGQTLLDLPAASLLVASRYQWKVFALDDTGQGVASETFEFHYSIATGHLEIATRDGAGDPLPHVEVQLVPLGGGGSALPIVTGDAGGWDDDLVPGAYLLTASRDGHEDASAEFVLDAGAESSVVLTLPASPAILAGVVRNGDLAPVPFATVHGVETQTGATRSVECGAGGAFQLGVSAGEWMLSAAKTGHHAGGAVVVAAAPGAWIELEEPLLLLPNSGTLGGRVLSGSGQPIVAALVAVTGDGADAQFLTGSDGVFQFSLEPGLWSVTASKPGFVAPSPRSVELAPDQDLTLDPPLVLSAEAALLGGFVLAGGGVVGGATVTAEPAAGSPVSVLCGGQGDWQLSLAAGSWNLFAQREGYSTLDTVQVNLAPGASQSGLDLALLAHPCSVSGQVNDGLLPIADAIVSAGGASTLSAWDGGYTLSLPTGSQALEAWATGYSSPPPLELELGPGETLSGIDLVLSPNAATVSGTVRSGGEPVAGATLHLLGDGVQLSRASGAEGNYSIGAPPGDYLLWALKEGMAGGDTLSLSCGPGQSLPGRDFALLPAVAALSGFVATAGAPLRDAHLVASSSLGEIATNSASDGAWSLQVPAGASWLVTATRSEYIGAEAATPVLAAGAAWSHDFDLAPQTASLAGTVHEPDGSPIAGATLLALGQGSTQSDAAGGYELGLEPGALLLRVSAPGFAEREEQLALEAGATELDLELAPRFASLTGTVRDGDGLPLAGALVAAPGGSAQSDATGGYQLPRLVAGSLTVTATHAGHASQVAEITLAELEAGVHDFALAALDGSFSGRVLTADLQPLPGALVQVRDGGASIAQSYSDASGVFHLTGLPVDRPLSLGASLTGHAALPGNPLADLWASQAQLELGLAPLDGTFAGHVLDAATLMPIAGASLEADDGAGYFAQAVSDADGGFSIGGLRRGSGYTLSADAPGWSAASLADLQPGATDIEVMLQPAPARLLVSLQPDRDDPDLALPADLHLRGIPGSASASELQVAVDAFGELELVGLAPGDYTLLFQVDGHLTAPRNLAVTLTEGETAGPFEFELVPAPLTSLAISGVDELDNDASALFQTSQSTDGEEQVQYPLTWSLRPPDAGELDPDTGRFTPRADFIGEAELTARHAASGLGARATVSVFARLYPGVGHALHDGRGLGLQVPPGAVAQERRITVRRRAASPVKRRAGGYRVEGEIFRLLPDGLAFSPSAEPTLSLPIPNPLFNDALALGWWDPARLRWEVLAGEKSALGLSRPLEHFSDYALLVANTALAVSAARVSPNPFSPRQGEAEIRFALASQAMAAPIVDVTVYNLLGDPVRRLLEHEALPVGSEQTVVWDGLTDAGELARNGRYLVRIEARDGDGDEDALLQLVLIK